MRSARFLMHSARCLLIAAFATGIASAQTCDRACLKTTLDQYLNAPHLAPTPYSVGQRGAIDVHLARERLKRHVVVTLPYFNLAPYVLVKSDLVFTTTFGGGLVAASRLLFGL